MYMISLQCVIYIYFNIVRLDLVEVLVFTQYSTVCVIFKCGIHRCWLVGIDDDDAQCSTSIRNHLLLINRTVNFNAISRSSSPYI